MSRAGKRVLTEETGERIAEALEGFSAPIAIEDALAIVCNGNTAPANIASGKYLFIKNHSTLPAGGYHATAAITAGSELNLGNVEPDEDGIANSLSEQIGTLFSDRIQSGVATFPAQATGIQSVQVTFPHAFENSPIVLCVWQDVNVYTYMDYPFYYSVSKTGCSLRANRKRADYGWDCRWVAIDIS